MKLNRNKFKGVFRKKLKNMKTFESFSAGEDYVGVRQPTTHAEKLRELYGIFNIAHLLLDEGYLDKDLNLKDVEVEDVLSFLNDEEGIDIDSKDLKDLIGKVKSKLR